MEENIEALLARKEDKLREYVESSLSFKKTFIEKDEFDRGIRIYLNFAHTFAHAFETISGYLIPHGTAVAMGTIVANRISLGRGWQPESQVTRVEDVLWKIIRIDKESVNINMDDVIAAIHKDKKQVGDQLTAVLMKGDQQLEVVHDVKREEIEEAVNYLFERV